MRSSTTNAKPFSIAWDHLINGGPPHLVALFNVLYNVYEVRSLCFVKSTLVPVKHIK